MGVADSYLASFRPVQPVAGFENVLSNAGMGAMGLIPREDAKLGYDLAAAALEQAGAGARLDRNLDAIRKENELTRRADRKFAGMKLASALMGSEMSGGRSQRGVDPGDPLALISRLTDFDRDQNLKISEQSLPVLTYARQVLKDAG